MFQKLIDISKMIFVLAMFALIGYGVYILTERIIRGVAQLETTIIAAILASFTGVFGYWYTQRQITSRNIEETHRPHKAERHYLPSHTSDSCRGSSSRKAIY